MLLSIHMNEVNRQNLHNEAALAAAAAEHGGVEALESLTLPDCRIQWTDASGVLLLDTAPGEADRTQTAVELSDGSTLTVSNTGYTLSHLLLQSFTPLLFVAILAVGLSAVLASRAARIGDGAIKPNRLLPPPTSGTWTDELKPVVRRPGGAEPADPAAVEDLNAEHGPAGSPAAGEFTANVSPRAQDRPHPPSSASPSSSATAWHGRRMWDALPARSATRASA